jgi:hypothetical protein
VVKYGCIITVSFVVPPYLGTALFVFCSDFSSSVESLFLPFLWLAETLDVVADLTT